MNSWYKIAQNQIFTESTGIPDYDELINNPEKIKETDYDTAEIVYMSPDQYLDQIKVGFWNKLSLNDKIKYENISNFWGNIGESRLSQSKVDAYYEQAMKNVKFPMPYIIYNENGKMTQEGHHRVEVAKKLKIPSIPVLVINNANKEADDSLYSENYQMEKNVTNYLESIGITGMVKLLGDLLEPEDFFIEKNINFWWNKTIIELTVESTNFNEYLNLENIYKAIEKAKASSSDINIDKELSEYMSNLNLNPTTMSAQQWIKLMSDLYLTGDLLSIFDYKTRENYMMKIGMIDQHGYPTDKGVAMTSDISKNGGDRLLKYPSVIAEEVYDKLLKGYLAKDKYKTEKLLSLLKLSGKEKELVLANKKHKELIMKNWYKLAQESKPEYLLENGVLLNEDDKPIFKIMDLVNHNVPKFKDATEANKFLEELEKKTKKPYGRVPVDLQIKNLKFKDTGKDRQDASRQEAELRTEKWKSDVAIDKGVDRPVNTTQWREKRRQRL